MSKIIFSSQSSHNLCRGNPKGLEPIIEPIILPEGTEFCNHIGKYPCCKKPCFVKSDYCAVRTFCKTKNKRMGCMG